MLRCVVEFICRDLVKLKALYLFIFFSHVLSGAPYITTHIYRSLTEPKERLGSQNRFKPSKVEQLRCVHVCMESVYIYSSTTIFFFLLSYLSHSANSEETAVLLRETVV